MKLWNWIKDITGNRNCNSVAELIAYVKPGDLSRLQYWVAQHIWYEADTKPSDNWQDLDLVMREKQSNCQEQAAIMAEVIKTWSGWSADIVHLYYSNPDDNHAICFCAFDKLTWIMDTGGIKYSNDKETLVGFLKRIYPKALCYRSRDKHGNYLSDKVYL